MSGRRTHGLAFEQVRPDVASPARFADGVVDLIECEESTGVAGGGEDATGLTGRHDRVAGACRTSNGTWINSCGRVQRPDLARRESVGHAPISNRARWFTHAPARTMDWAPTRLKSQTIAAGSMMTSSSTMSSLSGSKSSTVFSRICTRAPIRAGPRRRRREGGTAASAAPRPVI